MNSRLSQILIVLGALLAFVPVLAVDYLLDTYVRDRESQRLFASLESLTAEAQDAVYGGVSAIHQILNDSPSLCAPTFVANVQKQLQANIYLKQVLVENYDGVQYCNGFGAPVSYSMLSEGLTIPGNAESISVVRFAGETLPSLKVTRFVGANRMISAFVHISPRLEGGLPREFANAALLRIALTDGTEIITYGDPALADAGKAGGEMVASRVIADALPLMSVAAIPFEAVRAQYTTLDIGITMAAAMMSAAFLLLAFQYVRRVRLPVFDLERAIERNELKPFYQPIMNISTGRLAGCEVLVRWVKKDGKIVSPGMFIDYAEATGLAIPMTIKLMQQVRADLAHVCRDMPDLKVGINLFEGHFRDTSIVDDVQAIFDGSGISFRQLTFEITERRPLVNQMAVDGVIGGLQALGCRLAIDDAGTGHSNLEAIQTLGVDIIKIDRVFVSMIKPEADSVPVLDGLINMANDMGVEIVAEGVETEAQAVYLRNHGVSQAQGFLFAPALPTASFVELAEALNGAPARAGKVAAASTSPDAAGEAAEKAA